MSDTNNSGNNNNQQQNQQNQQPQGQQQTFTFTGNGGNAAANGSIWIYPVGPTYTITLGGDVGGGGTCEAATKKKNTDGCVCKKCKELYPYAEPNQSDGTLICYGCRMVW